MTIKILGPAGGRPAFDAALAAGADEIYMGLAGYGARQSAANFTCDEFCRALDDAHRFGVAVHLTFNTVMSEAEVERAAPDLARLDAAGLDAILVQDFGVADWLAENFPQLPRHASTQMALANRTEIAWAQEAGFARVVLPRELSFDEIASIRAGTEVELEVFVSGALCLACSGKCYLSSFIGGRSGNRGSCAQPCRQHYRVASAEGADPAASVGKSGYLLSLTDQLQGADAVARLNEIGVSALKIEGRMKSPAYVYEAVRYYRRIIDRIEGIAPELSRKMFVLKGERPEEEPTGAATDLSSLFNRGYGPGYLTEHDPAILHPKFASNFGRQIGRVENGAIRLSDSLRHGDGVVYVDAEFQKLAGENVSRIERLGVRSGERPERVAEAFANDRVLLSGPVPAASTALFRTLDFAVQKRIEHALVNVRRHVPIEARLKARVGQPLAIELTAGRIQAREESDAPLERSLKRKTTADELSVSLDRFGETPFVPSSIALDFDEDVFIPKSVLNQVRQKGAEKLADALTESARRPPVRPRLFARPASSSSAPIKNRPTPRFAALVRTDAQARAARKAGCKPIYRTGRPVRFEAERLANAAETVSSDTFAPLAKTIADAVEFQSRQIPFAADWFFNVGNLRAAEFLLERFPLLRTLYLSPELSFGAVTRLATSLLPKTAERGGRIALSVYGRLPGMTTRKTLFDADRVELVNQDGRAFYVVKNRSWFAESGDSTSDSAAEPLTGSTVYYAPINDLRRQIEPLTACGIDELRFDFTDEKPEEIDAIVASVRDGTERLPKPSDAYGFSYPIF